MQKWFRKDSVYTMLIEQSKKYNTSIDLEKPLQIRGTKVKVLGY